MSGVQKVSMAVIKRLPKYHRCLGNLLKNKVERVSSQELSKILGFTASQIRQDLNNFGEFGQQGYGYNVEQLYNAVSKILGLHSSYNVIIVGAGNLGQALGNYTGFTKHGFNIIAFFEADKKLFGKKIKGIPVLPVEDIHYFVNKHDVDIAILTVPQDEAQNIVDILAKTSIKGIWNFAPVKITAPPGIVVENIYLVESLFTLSYQINEEKLQKRMLKRRKPPKGAKSLSDVMK